MLIIQIALGIVLGAGIISLFKKWKDSRPFVYRNEKANKAFKEEIKVRLGAWAAIFGFLFVCWIFSLFLTESAKDFIGSIFAWAIILIIIITLLFISLDKIYSYFTRKRTLEEILNMNNAQKAYKYWKKNYSKGKKNGANGYQFSTFERIEIENLLHQIGYTFNSTTPKDIQLHEGIEFLLKEVIKEEKKEHHAK